MKIKLLLLLLSIVCLPSWAASMPRAQGTLSASQTCVGLDVTDQSTAGVNIGGTFTTALNPQVQVIGQSTFQPIAVYSPVTGAIQSTITSTGFYQAKVAGASTFQVCAGGVGSYGAIVTITATQAVATNGLVPNGPPVAYLATANGMKCDSTTDDTVAFQALITKIGSNSAAVLFPAGSQCKLGNITIPNNINLDFSAGGSLLATTGNIITLLGGLENPQQQKIFFNAGPSQGTIDFTGNTGVSRIYPEWWGANVNNTGGNAALNSAAIQAAIWAAYGCGPVTCRVNSGAGQKWNKELFLSTIFHINSEMQLYKIHGFVINCAGQDTGGLWQDGSNLRALDFQHVTYGNVNNCLFATSGSNDATHPIFTISANLGGDANSQFVTFSHDFFGCSVGDQIGGIISPNGESNGNNIDFVNSKVNNCPTGIAIGSGSAQACNALANMFISGDISGSTTYGLYANCGSWIVDSTTFEDGTTSQTGFDVICTHSLSFQPCILRNVRSESFHLASGQRLIVRDSGTIFQGNAWDIGNLAGTSGTLNQIVTGSSAGGGDGQYYIVTTPGTWGGLNNTAATAGSTTTITCGGCSFTVNAFTGMRVTIVSGTATSFYGIVSSNTATVITVASWIQTVPAQYSFFSGFPPPDATSHFIVEPNWGTQTTSGTVTFAQAAGSVITGEGGASTPCSYCTIENNQLIGFPILVQGSTIKDNIFSALAWYGNPTGGLFNDTLKSNYIIGNTVNLPCQGCAPGAGVMLWKTSASGGAIPNVGAMDLGTQPLIFSCTNARGGGVPCGESGIGGISDPSRQNTSGKVILETYGIVGRPAPYLKSNGAGSDMDIGGGESTGSGTGGSINFWSPTVGAGGTQVNALNKALRLSPVGNLEFLLGKGQHTNMQAANNDQAGTCTAAAATTCTVTFTTAYTSAPACIAVDATNITTLKVTPSTTTLVITTTGATSDTFDYSCTGNPN